MIVAAFIRQKNHMREREVCERNGWMDGVFVADEAEKRL